MEHIIKKVRFPLKYEERHEIANSYWDLHVKYGTSRGQHTYGYGLVSLYSCNEKIASCNGGGYDMTGTVFGAMLTERFRNQLQMLNFPRLRSLGEDLYGLSIYKNHRRMKTWREGYRIYCDGACGISSMKRIFEALGYKLESTHRLPNYNCYILEAIEGEFFEISQYIYKS